MTLEELVIHQNKFIGVYATMYSSLVTFTNKVCLDKDVDAFFKKLDVLLIDTSIKIHNLTVDLDNARTESRSDMIEITEAENDRD